MDGKSLDCGISCIGDQRNTGTAMQTLAASLLETGTRDSLVQDWSGRSRADPEGKYQYNMLNPGPLSEKEASSFYNCMYNCEVLQEDRIYYRIGTGDGRGRWFTAAPPESIIQGRLNSAIPLLWMDPEGNFDGASEIDTRYAFVVPKGTVVFTGPVRDQAGMSAGGLEHEQVYIRDISGITLKESYPIDTIPGEKTILNEASDNPVRLVPRKGHLVPDYLKVRDTEKITLEDHPDPTALKPEHMYIYNGNEYLTDKNGNLAYAHMIVKKTEGAAELKESHKEYRNTGGKNAEHPDMDAGHILAVSSGQHPSFTMEQHYATNRTKQPPVPRLHTHYPPFRRTRPPHERQPTPHLPLQASAIRPLISKPIAHIEQPNVHNKRLVCEKNPFVES